MANTSSAKKAQRVAGRRRVFNLRHKKSVKDALRIMDKHVASGKAGDAMESLSSLYGAIDKATKVGVFKKNTAARMKSRAANQIRKVESK